MRAIIIEDKDAIALLDLLKLANFEAMDKDKEHWFTIEQVHRKFHYVVCTWLQDQGCKVIR